MYFMILAVQPKIVKLLILLNKIRVEMNNLLSVLKFGQINNN